MECRLLVKKKPHISAVQGVADQKKNVRPSELQISETNAEVPQQNLLDHTAARIAS